MSHRVFLCEVIPKTGAKLQYFFDLTKRNGKNICKLSHKVVPLHKQND